MHYLKAGVNILNIVKIIAVALISVCISLILKQYRPEFSIYISMITCCMILFYIVQKIDIIIELLKSLSNKIDMNYQYLSILLKITGIAYLTEFASNICRDAGETAVASKVELAGRILIVCMSVPILSSLLETLFQLIS